MFSCFQKPKTKPKQKPIQVTQSTQTTQTTQTPELLAQIDNAQIDTIDILRINTTRSRYRAPVHSYSYSDLQTYNKKNVSHKYRLKESISDLRTSPITSRLSTPKSYKDI